LTTVQDMGWAGVKNGELLRRAENQFDLLLTADKRLRVLRPMLPNIEAAIALIVPGNQDQYFELSPPAEGSPQEFGHG
jgi:hypothetical protein